MQENYKEIKMRYEVKKEDAKGLVEYVSMGSVLLDLISGQQLSVNRHSGLLVLPWCPLRRSSLHGFSAVIITKSMSFFEFIY